MWKEYVPVISIDDLADEIMDMLEEYGEEVTEEMKAIVKQVSKECVQDIKEASPVKTGDYKRGWKQKVAFENEKDIRVTIYNNKKPQLTHLLEYGYLKSASKRVEGRAHIRPAEEKAKKKLMEKITEEF